LPRGEGDRLREDILAATEALLLETADESAVAMRAIADAVGVTPPSIYMHFADKDELILAVCARQFEKLDAYAANSLRGARDPLERLRRRGRAYIAFGVEHPAHYRILFMSKQRISWSDFDDDTMPGKRSFLQLVDDVQACIDAGRFRPVDAFVAATGIWAIVHGVTSLRIAMPGFPLVGEEVLTDFILDLVGRGMAP
jgi:AcrR family transcriptional regulator